MRGEDRVQVVLALYAAIRDRKIEDVLAASEPVPVRRVGAWRRGCGWS